MGNSKMKNMVVLRDLPSNVIEEAFVIIKPNLKIKQKREAKDCSKKEKWSKDNTQDYLIKEAEMLVENYAVEIEKKGSQNINFTRLDKRYKRLKKITTGVTVLALMGWFFCFL